MANKDILLVAKSLSNEKGVSEEVIFQAIESALAAVTAKRYDEGDALIRVSIDRKTGDYDTFRCWTIVADEDYVSEQQMTLDKAHKIDASLEIGDVVEEQVESIEFGRIAAQQAKQVIIQKVREAEREKISKQYYHRMGEILIGVVKRVTRDYLILDMGDTAEAIMLREEMIPREAFRINDRLRAILYEVSVDRRGPQLHVSRTRPEFLRELFKIEVPEIGEEVIEVKAVARDPGSRAKVAVKTNDGRIDPIGACVGMRGSRVQAVSNELGGERIDIVLWDDKPAQLVINAMAPAEVASIMVDEETHSMDIIVNESQLSQAIGRNGQNVRLASGLTGWTLNVMTEVQASEKHEKETHESKTLFMNKLDVDEEIADVLVAEGFTAIEDIAYIPSEEMADIEGFDEDLAQELQRRASDVLLTQEIAQEEGSHLEPSGDLLSLEGMSVALAEQLAHHGIATREDLAEQAVDELTESCDIDPKVAADLIMKARAHWFE